jgi:hypothetical protein
MPGSKTPSFPFGAAILVGFSMNFLSFQLVEPCRGSPTERKLYPKLLMMMEATAICK